MPPPSDTERPQEPLYPQVPPPPGGTEEAIPRRLNPAVLGVWAIGQAAPLAFLLLAGTFDPRFAGGVAAIGLVGALARWLRFTYRVDSDGLVIDQGLLQRQRRVIRLDRIQSVETVRKLRHRLFGVVELRVETIGGGSTEGRLEALSPDTAKRLQRLLLQRDQAVAGGDEAEPATRLLARVRPGMLVAAGVTGGRVGVVAALLGFAQQALGERVSAVFQWLPGLVGGVRGFILAAALFMLAVFVLSVVATTVSYWDFTLTRDAARLYTRRGLLEQRSGTVPLRRVQAVRVEENLVRRLFGWAAVRVEVAGRAGSEDAQETNVVLPMGSRAQALALVDAITGQAGVGSVGLRAMPRRALARRLVRAAIATLLATAASTIWLGSPGLAGLVSAIPFSALAVVSYRALGMAEPPGMVVARAGVLVRRTHFVPEASLQGLALVSTPFQRRRKLSSLELHIARSPGRAGDPTLIDMDAEEARRLQGRLAAVSAGTAKRVETTEGVRVRSEAPQDLQAVRAVNLAAFESAAEADLVDALRETDAFALSLVAERDDEVVGHLLLSWVDLDRDGKRRGAGHARVLSLAPMAVRPQDQGSGVGSALVRQAIRAATSLGAPLIVVLGHADYYPRFGFEPARPHGIESPYEVDDAHWLVRLLPADDGTARGRVVYPAAFDSV